MSIETEDSNTFSLDMRIKNFKDNNLSEDFKKLNNIIEHYWNLTQTENKIINRFIDFRKELKGDNKLWTVSNIGLNASLKSFWEKLTNQPSRMPMGLPLSQGEWEVISYTSTAFQTLWNYFPNLHDEIWNEVENEITTPWIKYWLDDVRVSYRETGLNLKSRLSSNNVTDENDHIIMMVNYDSQPMFKNIYNQIMPELVESDLLHLVPYGYSVIQINQSTSFILIESVKKSMGNRLIDKYMNMNDDDIKSLSKRLFLESFRKTEQVAYSSNFDSLVKFREDVKSLSKPTSICLDLRDYNNRIGNWGTSPRVRDDEVMMYLDKLDKIKHLIDEHLYELSYSIFYERRHLNILNNEWRKYLLHWLITYAEGNITRKQLIEFICEINAERIYYQRIIECR